jgi:broad specificity phosphatase PhoE
MRSLLYSLVAGTAFIVTFAPPSAAQTQDSVARGAYLVNGPAACGNCHFIPLVLLLLLLSVLCIDTRPAIAQSAPPMVVLVRHAEFVLGTSDDPSLNDAGRKRAQDLAVALHDAGVSAILTSEFRRTRETAQPIAAALELTPKAIGAGDGLRAHLAALARAVRGEQSGSVLVIGHSETVPMLIAELGGPRLRNLCEAAFDRLFVLVPAGGKMLLTRARYGAASPGAGADCS